MGLVRSMYGLQAAELWRGLRAWLVVAGLAAALLAPAAAQTAPAGLRIDAGMHTQPITGIAADRQGRWVATVSTDQTLKIWDAASQRLERTVVLAAQPGLDGAPTAVAMSPDGRSVVVAGRALPPQLVDRASGELRQVGEAPGERVVELVWAPDGRTIAALLGGRGGVRLYDAATLKPLGGLPEQPVIGMDLGAEGRLLAYLFDGSLRLFEPRDGRWTQVAAGRLSEYWRGYKDPKPGERRSGWDEPGPGVVRIAPDGRHAAVARVGLLRIAIVALPTLQVVEMVAPPDRSQGAFGPLAWNGSSDQVLFVGGAWPSAARDELGLIDLRRDPDPHARAPASRVRLWSPEGVAGDRTPMPAPHRVQAVPQGFVFATTEPSWGVFRADQPRSQRVERVTLSLSAASLAGGQTVDAAGHPLFLADTAEGLQPVRFDLEKLQFQTLQPRTLERGSSERTGTRQDAETLWRDDGTGRRLWSVALPAVPVGVTTRAGADGSGFVAARLADGSWRWYRYADGAELLALYITRDTRRWVAWTPAGEAAGDLTLLRRTVPRGGAYTLAELRGELKPQPQAIARALLAPAPEVVAAAAAAASSPLRVVSPLGGSSPSRDLVTLTVRVPREVALQAVDVRIDERAVGRVDVSQMRRAEGPAGDGGLRYSFELRQPMAPARITLTGQFGGGVPRAEAAVTLGKPLGNRPEWNDVTFFNPLTRDLRACSARSVPLDEAARQLRAQVDAAVARHVVPNGHSMVEWVYPVEVDMGLALLYADRPQEAEAWARARLELELLRIPRNMDDYSNRNALVARRIALMALLGRTLHTRNPQEAERWLQQAHALQLEQWQPAQLGCQNSKVTGNDTYCGALRTRLVARHRAQLWGDFHESTGRLAEARDVFDAAARAYAEGYDPRPKDAEPFRARADELEAQIALRDGSLSPALRATLLKAPSPAAVVALARAGHADDARKAAASISAAFDKRLPAVFEPRRTSLEPPKPDAVVPANACPVHFDPAARKPGDSRSAVEPLREASATADLGSRVALALLAAGDADAAFRTAEATYAAAAAYFGAAHPLALQAQAAMARVQAARGRAAEALDLWRPWAAKFNAAIGDQLWGLGEDARRALLRPARANVEALYASLAQAARDGSLRPDDVELAAAVALASRGLLTRTAAEINGLARSRGDPASRQAVEQLDAARRELAALAQRGDADGALLAAARARRDALESKLAAQLQGRRSADRATPAAVAGALGSGEALVEFLAFRSGEGGTAPAGLLALVSSGGGAPRRLVPYADLAPVERALAEYRRSVEPQGGGDKAGRAARLRQSAQALHAALWAPLEPLLQGRQRVWVVPDGVVATVPLHALAGADGEALATRIDLRVLNAPQTLIERPAAAVAGRALVLGGPDFGGTPRRGAGSDRAVTLGIRLQDLWFAPLPGALAEATAVGRLLQPAGGATVLTGAQATKQAVFAAQAPRVMHLATHGYFLDDVRAIDEDEDPLQALALSGLALRGANVALAAGVKNSAPASRDGLLTALEVTALDLRRTQLVVLSACETGLGRLQNGEGVLGLTRAFHEAGARFVLSTLWSIDDEGTKAFMDLFYAEIAAGRAPADALAAARQAFLRHPRFSDPYYWAPFVLTGA